MFQSTHPHGVRQQEHWLESTESLFQSTHPHGVRRGDGAHRENHRCFNPRTRTGCDINCGITLCSTSQFQSTHPHGVRRRWIRYMRWKSGFNPRTRTGCDRRCPSTTSLLLVFQSTHPHGVRLAGNWCHAPRHSRFQSTHPHGVRHALFRNRPDLVKFQSTHQRCVLLLVVKMLAQPHPATRSRRLIPAGSSGLTSATDGTMYSPYARGVSTPSFRFMRFSISSKSL